MILDDTTKTLEVLLASAVTTSQLPVVVGYSELDAASGTLTPKSNDTATNSTTAVTILAAPASGKQRVVDQITIYNADTVSVTYTIQYNNNSTLRIVRKATLAPGMSDIWTRTNGWLTSLQPAPDATGTLRNTPGFRLTLTAATPVTITDVTGATTVYCSPMDGGSIWLWNGTRWVLCQPPEFAIALGTLTNAKPYDVFAFTATATPSSTNTSTDIVTFGSATGWQTGAVVYPATSGGGLTAGTAYWWNAASSTTGSFHATLAAALAGTSKVDLTASISSSIVGYSLEVLVWTNDTTRATAVTMQDFYCKSGDKTRLHMGYFYTTATTTTEDSVANRYLCNRYNRRRRKIFICPAYNNNNTGNTYTLPLAADVYALLNAGTGATANYLANGEHAAEFTMCLFAVVPSGYAAVAGIGDDSTAGPAVSQVASNGQATLTMSLRTAYAESKRSVTMLGYGSAGACTIYADNVRAGGSSDPAMTYLSGSIMG